MNFEFEDEQMTLCQEAFNLLDPEKRLTASHYDLAKLTAIQDSTLWKHFLMDTRVSDWINQEVTLYKEAQLRKMIAYATDDRRSYGAAQMINALNKSFDSDTQKEGNIFIYSMVPLNQREQGAPNTQILPMDIFERGE
jgi:hypothetical protein